MKNYWKKRCELAEKVIAKTPKPERVYYTSLQEAHDNWIHFINLSDSQIREEFGRLPFEVIEPKEGQIKPDQFELQRRQLWIDIYKAEHIAAAPFYNAFERADEVVAKFDKRFNQKTSSK